jgi:hypothetical protein
MLLAIHMSNLNRNNNFEEKSSGFQEGTFQCGSQTQ